MSTRRPKGKCSDQTNPVANKPPPTTRHRNPGRERKGGRTKRDRTAKQNRPRRTMIPATIRHSSRPAERKHPTRSSPIQSARPSLKRGRDDLTAENRPTSKSANGSNNAQRKSGTVNLIARFVPLRQKSTELKIANAEFFHHQKNAQRFDTPHDCHRRTGRNHPLAR